MLSWGINKDVKQRCLIRADIPVVEVNRAEWYRGDVEYLGQCPVENGGILIPEYWREGGPKQICLDFGFLSQLEEIHRDVVPDGVRAIGLMRMIEVQSANPGGSIFALPDLIPEITFRLKPNPTPDPEELSQDIFGRCIQFILRMFVAISAANTNQVGYTPALNTDYKPRYFELDGCVVVSGALSRLVAWYFRTFHFDVPAPNATATYPPAKFTITSSQIIFSDYRLPLGPIVYFNYAYATEQGKPTFGQQAMCSDRNNFLPHPNFDIPALGNGGRRRSVYRGVSWMEEYTSAVISPLHSMCVIEVDEEVELPDGTFDGPQTAMYQMPSLMEYLTTPIPNAEAGLCSWLSARAVENVGVNQDAALFYAGQCVSHERAMAIAADESDFDAAGHDIMAHSYSSFLTHDGDMIARKWHITTPSDTDLDRTHWKATCTVEVTVGGFQMFTSRNNPSVDQSMMCDLNRCHLRPLLLSYLLSGQHANHPIAGVCQIRVTWRRLMRRTGLPGSENGLAFMPGPAMPAAPLPAADSGGDEMDMNSIVTDICC